MKINYLLCAENVLRDTDSGLATIYNLLDGINSPAYPFLIPKLAIYFYCTKDEEDLQSDDVVLKILNNEKQLFSNTIKVNFSERTKNRSIIKFNGFAVPAPGLLIVQIFSKDEKEKLKDSVIILSTTQSKPIAKSI